MEELHKRRNELLKAVPSLRVHSNLGAHLFEFCFEADSGPKLLGYQFSRKRPESYLVNFESKTMESKKGDGSKHDFRDFAWVTVQAQSSSSKSGWTQSSRTGNWRYRPVLVGKNAKIIPFGDFGDMEKACQTCKSLGELFEVESYRPREKHYLLVKQTALGIVLRNEPHDDGKGLGCAILPLLGGTFALSLPLIDAVMKWQTDPDAAWRVGRIYLPALLLLFGLVRFLSGSDSGIEILPGQGEGRSTRYSAAAPVRAEDTHIRWDEPGTPLF